MPDGITPLFGLSQRLPPSNIPAEQALLGAILANNKAYEAVAEFLRPIHFADAINGRIYQSICTSNRVRTAGGCGHFEGHV
jgi:replicative DNA helicase